MSNFQKAQQKKHLKQVAKKVKREIKNFNKELYYLNTVYHSLKDMEAAGIEVNKNNIDDYIGKLTDYKFKQSSIDILKDDYFKER